MSSYGLIPPVAAAAAASVTTPHTFAAAAAAGIAAAAAPIAAVTVAAAAGELRTAAANLNDSCWKALAGYSNSDREKINKINEVFARHTLLAKIDITRHKVINYSFREDQIPDPAFVNLHIRERIQEICAKQTGYKAFTETGERKFPAPEGLFLEEVKVWIVESTRSTSHTPETLDEINEKISSIKSVAGLKVDWNEDYRNFLREKIYDLLSKLRCEIHDNIEKNKTKILLDKMKVLGNDTVKLFLHLLYLLSDLNLDNLDLTSFIPDKFIEEQENLKSDPYGCVILSLISHPDFKKLMDCRNLQMTGLNISKHERLYNNMLCMIDLFMLCNSYKDFGERKGSSQLNRMIKENKVTSHLKHLTADFEETLQETRQTVEEKKNTPAYVTVYGPGDDEISTEKYHQITVVIKELEYKIKSCLSLFSKITILSTYQERDTEIDEQVNAEVLKYVRNLKARVEQAKSSRPSSKNEKTVVKAEEKSDRDQKRFEDDDGPAAAFPPKRLKA